jgi:hypothetical protein
MTNEQLTAYLQDESYLYSLNYEELKTLVVQYPYAANLRVLLLKKSYIEQNKDYDRNLQMASAYISDRRFLYKTIKRMKTLQIIPENVILGEDFLELTSLSNLDKVVKEKQVVETSMSPETAKALSSGFILDFESPDLTQEDEDTLFDMTLPVKKNENLEYWDDANLDILVENLVHEFQPNGSKSEVKAAVEAKQEQFEADYRKVDVAEVALLEDLIVPKSLHGEDSIIDDEILKMDSFKNGQVLEDILTDIQPEIKIETFEQDESLIENTTNIEILPKPSIESVEKDPLSIENAFLPEAEIETDTTVQNIDIQPLVLFTPSQQLFDKIEDDDMKKQDIELEIINQTKATIISNEVASETLTPKVSFAEWLQQFKMVAVSSNGNVINSKPIVAKVEPVIPVQKTEPNKVTTHTTVSQPLLITELPNASSRVVQQETMAQIFEKKEILPENLFNLNPDTGGVDEAVYKDKIEAIFDDFLTNKASTQGDSYVIETPQVIEKEEIITQTKKEGSLENSILEIEDSDDEEDDELPQETKTKKLHEWAKQSLVEDDELVSETLANMFAKQGNYKKAIEMYERLSLQIPEKSNFFAAKIQELRIKIVSIF